MTTPAGGHDGPTHIKVYKNPHTVVEFTGPTEAAVLRGAAEWLESLDGAVVVVAVNWQSLREDEPIVHGMDLTVDMSIAV